MPEGDTVWLAGKRLHEALAGHELVRTDFRVPQLAATIRAWPKVDVVQVDSAWVRRMTTEKRPRCR